MIIAPSAQNQIDSYLNELSTQLQAAPPEDTRDFIEEIRSHILEAATNDGQLDAATVSAALADLGPAPVLAANYIKQNVSMPTGLSSFRLVEPRRNFARGRHGVLRAVRLFLALIVACGCAAVSVVCVISKIFHPGRAGLWRFGSDEFSLHLGLRPDFVPPPVSQELLGWYIVPLALLIGILSLVAANQIVRRSLRQLRLNRHTETCLIAS
jgi:hypothetical protein